MYGWNSERVRLVPVDFDRHFDNACEWINTPEQTAQLLAGDLPMSKLAEREWFDRVAKGTDTEILFAIETIHGEHIGFSGIHHINRIDGFATSGSYIGKQELWGQGLGTEASILRARYAFDVLGLRMLLSGFIGDNQRSKRMQEKVGYEVVGVIPGKYWKRGGFRDETLTVLTRERFFSLHGESGFPFRLP